MGRSKADVRSVYDRIAESYAAARSRPWPNVIDFIAGIPAGAMVLDVGCGHGRHARPLALTGHRVVGFDVSRRLLEIARTTSSSSRQFGALAWLGADTTALPFRDATFDAAICIAVIHHLPTERDRRRAVSEIRRVLVPGGAAFVSVWAADDPYLESVLGKRPTKPDVEIPWRLPDGSSVLRPYHLFREGELEKLVIGSGLHGERFFRDAGNWFAQATTDG